MLTGGTAYLTAQELDQLHCSDADDETVLSDNGCGEGGWVETEQLEEGRGGDVVGEGVGAAAAPAKRSCCVIGFDPLPPLFMLLT